MTDKLTDNDRQRIEQEVIRLTNWHTGYTPLDKNSDFYIGAKKGAEYATIYEREQWKEWRTEAEAKLIEYGKFVSDVEAERSELRKENEELKFLLEFGKSYLPQGYVNDSKGNGFIFKDRLEAALNSLKTK